MPSFENHVVDRVHSQCNGCFLQVVCVSQEVDHEWHVVKTQNGICDFNCSLAMISFKNNWGLDGFVWPSCRGHSFLMLL